MYLIAIKEKEIQFDKDSHIEYQVITNIFFSNGKQLWKIHITTQNHYDGYSYPEINPLETSDYEDYHRINYDNMVYYEPKNIFFSDFKDNDHWGHPDLYIETKKGIEKLVKLRNIWYGVDTGHKILYNVIYNLKLKFTPNSEFYSIIDLHLRNKLKTILTVAAKGHILECKDNLTNGDLWLPIELWYIILELFILIRG